MAIFKVTVTAIAKTTYTVDVEAKDEQEAERMACSSKIYRDESDPEFQVSHDGCEFRAESKQLTAACPECGKEHPLPTDDTEPCNCRELNVAHIRVDGVCVLPLWGRGDQYCCPDCDAKIEAEEAAKNAN